MSETPRTLEALTQVLDRDGRLEDDNVPFVLVRLTKTLERELNAAKAEIEAMKKALQSIYLDDIFDATMREIAKEALAKLK